MSYFVFHSHVSVDHGARNNARQAERAADRAGDDVLRLERALERMALGCAAMWELLSADGGHTEEQLLAKIAEIDLRDGVRDGRMSAPPRECPQCERRNAARRSRCLYCGEPLAAAPFGG